MSSNSDFWDARMEYPQRAPVAEIVELLAERPRSLDDLAAVTGFQRGHVYLFIQRARTLGHRIVAEGMDGAAYRLVRP